MKLERIDRRRFLQTSLLGSTAALAAANLGDNAFGAVTKPERDPDGGLKLGVASYTFRKFTLEQAIDMTKQAGFKYINLKDVHLPLKSTTAERKPRGKRSKPPASNSWAAASFT